MAVTFILGRAGTGKSRRIVDRLVEAVRADPLGQPVFWLLPRQATFMSERELTVATGAFARVRVVSFDLLGRIIAESCGGSAVPEITPLGRQLILGHLLRRNQGRLQYFASSARQRGLATELDATFAEFERSGQGTAELADHIDHLRHATPEGDEQGLSTLAKLRDLHLLYDAYANYLGQDRLDQHRRLEQVLKQIEECELLRGASVYVDGFHEFSEYERRVLAKLGTTCASLEIALTLDSDAPAVRDPMTPMGESDPFFRTIQTYRRLMLAMQDVRAKVATPVVMKEPRRFATDELRVVERVLASPLNSGEGVRVRGGTSGRVNPANDGLWESGPAPLPSALTTGEREEAGRQEYDPHALRAETFAEAPDAQHVGSASADAVNRDTQRSLKRTLREHLAPVALVEAPDGQAEVEFVARSIRDRLRNGERFRDIAVLARDIGPYQQAIDTVFAEHGIAWFVDRRRSASHHPLMQFMRSAIHIARVGWVHMPVMTLLRSGLAGISLDEADELENYLLRHRLRGNAWESADEWLFHRRRRHDDDDAAAATEPETDSPQVDPMRRRLVDGLRPLCEWLRGGRPLVLRDAAAAVFAVFERFGVRETLARWTQAAREAGDLELAGEHEQVWAELVDFFDQMVDLLGDEQLTPTDFADVLESGLERFDLALTPPTLDQVLVGSIDRTRVPAVKTAFVLGLNQGQFPLTARDTSLLSRGERRTFRQRNIDLDPDATRRQLDEDFYAYLAFTRASHRLIVSRPLVNDSGKAAEPSAYWLRLWELFPEIEVARIERGSAGDLAHIATPRQLLAAVMGWARKADGSADDAGASLYALLAGRAGSSDLLDQLRSVAWAALSYRNESLLQLETARLFFPSPLKATAGQLETLASCPFRHFARYGLRLVPRERGDVTRMDMSQVYHEVLELLTAEMMEGQRDWNTLSAGEARDLVGRYTPIIGQRLRGELMLSTARNRYLLGRIERMLQFVIASVKETLDRGEFAPAFTGVRFGEGGRLPAIELPTGSGRAVQLSGRIDRVDLHEDEPSGRTVAAAMDYKLSANTLSAAQIHHGLSLQLLTYLLVLEAHGEQLAGRPLTPAAAFYVQLLRELRKVNHPSEAPDPADPDFHLARKPRGLLLDSVLHAIDKYVVPGERSKVVNVQIKKDGHIGNRNSSDAADAEQFAAMLDLVRRKLGALADEVMAGEVSVRPYRIGQTSPCPRCDYRAVCRFEPAVSGYRHLPVVRREELLDSLTGRAQGGSDE